MQSHDDAATENATAANALYAAGDFASAVARYSQAIDAIECDADALATLYSNRAACHLKLGAASNAEHDAALALALRRAAPKPGAPLML